MQITSRAKEEILRNAKYLKITVELGGCAGLQYDLEYTDILSGVQLNEVLITDKHSAELLNEAELDFVDELGYKEFVIHNKKAKSGCGCGNSFSV